MIAQYLSNIRTDINASLLDFSKIDFETFRKLSDEGHLKFIQADQLWKVLLIVIAAEIVFKNESTILGFPKFGELKKIIDEFYDNRFNPEFPVVIQLIEKFDKLSKLANQYIGEDGASEGVEESIIVNEASSPLNSILRKFENSFLRSRVSSDHIIFIDRIDIKPDNIEFEKFILGLRAFARAVLSLNEEVFSKMKGRKRIKFVLLVRPDIFDRLNLQNQSARASDNSTLLSWDTTYEHHRTSDIFSLTDRFLGRQTKMDFLPGAAWDHFVDRDVYHFDAQERPESNRAFREFLRVSWFRPRDIIRALYTCQSQAECQKRVTRQGFERSFKDFSEYLFGEVKDFSRFYFSDDTFSLIERFFSELNSIQEFNYESYLEVHDRFLSKVMNSAVDRVIDPRVADPDEFLQILYSSNIICWRQKNDFGTVDDYWAFRERSATQLEPKVGLYALYGIHYGLRRALRLRQNLVTGVRD